MQEYESDRVFGNVFADNLEIEHNYYYRLGSTVYAYRSPAESHVTGSIEVWGRWMRGEKGGRGKMRNLGVRGRMWEEEKTIMIMG